jgi:hypothetical protein
LIGSGLPKNLWAEAILSAVYLLNRSPTKALEIVTPAEKWYGLISVRLEFLEVWLIYRNQRNCKHGNLIVDPGNVLW